MYEVVMPTLVSSLTATMLLVHVLFGCCRHCGDRFIACEHTEASASLMAGCCHHEHGGDCRQGESHNDELPVVPCSKLECKALCISLPPERTQVDAGQLELSTDIVAVALPTANPDSAPGHSYLDALRNVRMSEPPLRLHLLHQIILI
jgi:hypothetical protein